MCLRFLVLTAVRPGETRGARWSEIDVESTTWTIPAERMKANGEHRVPLSSQALDVLGKAKPLDDGSGLVFPSPPSRVGGAAGWRAMLRAWPTNDRGARMSATETNAPEGSWPTPRASGASTPPPTRCAARERAS
ncbi:tyrosine-type recombinase/integrase [Candidatus Poriferisodalis sp.]|uniref:tyrosine-type recombinase/integrase n=1 Tax=Candidatus Poriferisodalis sp. TaxID=3101277 RepID=UPI003B027E2B